MISNRIIQSAALYGSVLAGLAGLGLAGCDKGGGGGGGSGTSSNVDASKVVAIVDLDRVAKDLGWMTKMEANLTAYRNMLVEDVKAADGVYGAQIQDRVKGMLPKDMKENQKVELNQAQSQELTNYVMAARQQVGNLASQGDQLFNNYRMAWHKQYRESLMPVVRQVAQDKHVTVVFSQIDNVLYAEPAIDLTNAVVDAARAKPPTLTDVPMEHLKVTQNIPAPAPVMGASTQSATKSATTKP